MYTIHDVCNLSLIGWCLFAGKPLLTYDKNQTDVTSKVGVRHVIEVEYSGKPMPTITWRKDGQPLEDPSLIETRETITVLSLKKLVPSHGGSYTVSAENSVGKDVATFNLDVKGELFITNYGEVSWSSFNEFLSVSVSCHAMRQA